MAAITLFFDFVSPYAYLAWRAWPELVAPLDGEVEAVPVLFAGLLNHHGHLGPAEIPAKRDYVFRDALRRARLAGWPLVAPPAHPFNPLRALRLVAATPAGAQRDAVIDACFAVAWQGARPAGADRGLDDPAVIEAVAHEAVGGGAAAELLVAARSEAVKARLQAATDGAIAAGVFGVPSFLARRGDHEALFWGYETVDLVARYLREGELFAEAEIEGWRHTPVGARRQ